MRKSVCMPQRFSHVQLFGPLWTIACQAPLFMGFSRHEYWSGLPCPPPVDFPDPGTEPVSLALAVGVFTQWATREAFSASCSCAVVQSCPTLYNFMDCSPPDSSVHGILQARRLDALLQGIVLTQGLKLGLLYSTGNSLSHLYSTCRFFTGWATRESYFFYKW